MSKKLISFFILIIFCRISFSQAFFYDLDSIREIHIYFYDLDWDTQLDDIYIQGNNDRILANITLDGLSYDSVGVRYKGFSSASVDRIKNPFNIKLDYIIEDQNHDGIDKLKLSNVYQDPSFIREVLTYEIASNYMPTAEANFANVYINDTLWGLYTNVQTINKDFLKDHFGTKYGPFFKCNPNVLDISPGAENSNLSDTHGIDSLNYLPYYAIKSNYGWKSLYNFIDTLNNFPNSIDKVLNIDRTLWMHAINYTLINFDSYIGYSQNYYLYKDATNQFNPILWDLNMSFGSFRLSDASSMYFSGFNINQAQNMDPLLHHYQISVSPRPLLRNLFINERNRKMYLAHIRTIIKENFLNQEYILRAQYLQDLISTSVQNDTNKFYSYSDFLDNFNSQVLLFTDFCPGITQLMDARTNYLINYKGFSGEPQISNISYSPQNFSLGDDVFITANISDETDALLAYRFGDNMSFKTIPMFDDGNHNDGVAYDGIYGGKITNTCNNIDYYLYAENDSAGVFSPVRAAFEFYSIKSQIGSGDLVINEIMSNNLTTVVDPSQKYEDWIEIYNTSNSSISTDGLFLTDSIDILHKWKLPNYNINPGEYAIIWADEDGGQGDMHSNFKLSNFGETLILTNLDSNIIDSITFLTQPNDVSFGRSPNGYGFFSFLTPTFKSNNDFPNFIANAKHNILVYPNPFTDVLFLGSFYTIEVRDVIGRKVIPPTFTNYIRTVDWKPGVYFVYLSDYNYSLKVIKTI